MGRLSRNGSLYIVAGSLLVIVAIAVIRNAAFAGAATPIAQIEKWMGIPDETDAEAPVDYGPGPGVKPGVAIAGKESTAVNSAAAKAPQAAVRYPSLALRRTHRCVRPCRDVASHSDSCVLLPNGR